MISAHAFFELLHTERRYTNDIHTLLNVYLHQLARFPPLDIPISHCKLITRNTHQLLQHHTRFLTRLEAVFKDYHLDDLTDPAGISSPTHPSPLLPLAGDISKLFIQSFEVNNTWTVYEEFCAGHTHAMALLRSYANTKPIQWNAFEKYCSDKLDPPSSSSPSPSSTIRTKHKLTFQDYLIMPVQRICKYPLLLSAAFAPVTPRSIQERSIEVMKEVIAAVDRREGEERMRTVRRRLGLVTANIIPSTMSVNIDNITALASSPQSGHPVIPSGSAAIDGVELVLTGAVQAKVPTSSNWEYLAAFLTCSSASISSVADGTAITGKSKGKVVLLLARVERVMSSEEDLLSSAYSAYSDPGFVSDGWRYEVVWGVPLSSTTSSDPNASVAKGVFQVELCDDPPNTLRFVPGSTHHRNRDGNKPRRFYLSRCRSRSASDLLESGEKSLDIESFPSRRRSRTVSASVVESNRPPTEKTLGNSNDPIVGLPPESLTSPPILICQDPTEPPSNSRQTQVGMDFPKTHKREAQAHVHVPTPPLSASSYAAGNANRIGLPPIPSPSIQQCEKFDDDAFPVTPTATVETPRNLTFVKVDKSDVSDSHGGEGGKSILNSMSRSRSKKGKKSHTLPAPNEVVSSGSSFTVISGSRNRINTISDRPAPINVDHLERSKSKRRSKIFFMNIGVEDTDYFGPTSAPSSRTTFSKLGDESIYREGYGEGLTMMRTACIGEREVWLEKMKECGVIVVPRRERSLSRSHSRLAKGLSRPKSTSAVNASYKKKENGDVEGEVEKPALDPLPTASTTFRLESRCKEGGRTKAMSDIGHGSGEMDGHLPQSRSAFVSRFPPGISSSTKESSQSHTRTLSGSSPSLPPNYSFLPYASLLRGGSKRIFHYNRASAPPGSIMVIDTGDVDEGIMDIASDVLIRKRHRAKMMGETLFPIRSEPNSKDQISSSSAASYSSPSTPSTTPEELIGTTLAQGFESFRRASTLVRLHSVRSVISIGNSVSDAMSLSSAGIRRSMTVGNIGRKGKGRLTDLETQSSSVHTSATSSPIREGFEVDLPPVVSGEELSTQANCGGHVSSASSPIIFDKPLPGRPLPSACSEGYQFRSEPPTPAVEARGYFTTSHSEIATPRNRSSLFSLPDNILQRLSILKPSPQIPTPAKARRPHSILIPPEHRQPVEYIKKTTASSSSSFRIRRELTMASFLKSSKTPLPPSPKSEAITARFNRRPSLLQRTFTFSRKSKPSPRPRLRMHSEHLERHSEEEGVNLLLPEIPDRQSDAGRKQKSSEISVTDSLAQVIAVNVQLSHELSGLGLNGVGNSGSSTEGPTTPIDEQIDTTISSRAAVSLVTDNSSLRSSRISAPPPPYPKCTDSTLCSFESLTVQTHVRI